MADNVVLPATGTGTADVPVATDKVTYSGDAGQNVQLMRPVLVTGSEGSKTVVDLPGDNTNGLDVDVTRMAALVAGTALVGKVSIDQVTANANEVVLKTGSTTAVTQATAANLNATVIGAGSAGTANAGVVTVQGIASMTPVLITGTGAAGTAATGVQTVQGIASMTPVQVSQATAATLNCTEASAAAIKTAVEIIDNPVLVDDAAFTVAASSLMMAGKMAVAVGSDPDTADAGDAVVAITNRHRVPFVIGGHPNTLTLKHTTITTAVTDAAIVTISTGSKIVVTRISATLDNASTVFPTVLIGFGTANTPTTTAVLMAHGGFPAGGGMTIGDGSGIVGIGADNEDLRVTTTGNATGNGLQIVVSYFLLPT